MKLPTRNIGFICYTYYPVTGGAPVHGYHLAKELHNPGYRRFIRPDIPPG